MHRLLLAKIAQFTELPNLDGTAEYGRGHDGSPQDGYRGSRWDEGVVGVSDFSGGSPLDVDANLFFSLSCSKSGNMIE